MMTTLKLICNYSPSWAVLRFFTIFLVLLQSVDLVASAVSFDRYVIKLTEVDKLNIGAANEIYTLTEEAISFYNKQEYEVALVKATQCLDLLLSGTLRWSHSQWAKHIEVGCRSIIISGTLNTGGLDDLNFIEEHFCNISQLIQSIDSHEYAEDLSLYKKLAVELSHFCMNAFPAKARHVVEMALDVPIPNSESNRNSIYVDSCLNLRLAELVYLNKQLQFPWLDAKKYSSAAITIQNQIDKAEWLDEHWLNFSNGTITNAIASWHMNQVNESESLLNNSIDLTSIHLDGDHLLVLEQRLTLAYIHFSVGSFDKALYQTDFIVDVTLNKSTGFVEGQVKELQLEALLIESEIHRFKNDQLKNDIAGKQFKNTVASIYECNQVSSRTAILELKFEFQKLLILVSKNDVGCHISALDNLIDSIVINMSDSLWDQRDIVIVKAKCCLLYYEFNPTERIAQEISFLVKWLAQNFAWDVESMNIILRCHTIFEQKTYSYDNIQKVFLAPSIYNWETMWKTAKTNSWPDEAKEEIKEVMLKMGVSSKYFSNDR